MLDIFGGSKKFFLEYLLPEIKKSRDTVNNIFENQTANAPLNFRWIGFIKILFPNSKIIHRDKWKTT